MKRYLAFAGRNYYPSGGWSDLRGEADTVDEAKTLVEERFDWWHIVDCATGKKIQSGERDS